jgi:hypothetical protein
MNPITFNEIFSLEIFAWEEDGIGGFIKVNSGSLPLWGKAIKSQKDDDKQITFFLKKPPNFTLSASDYLVLYQGQTFKPKKIKLEDNLIKIDAYEITENLL